MNIIRFKKIKIRALILFSILFLNIFPSIAANVENKFSNEYRKERFIGLFDEKQLNYINMRINDVVNEIKEKYLEAELEKHRLYIKFRNSEYKTKNGSRNFNKVETIIMPMKLPIDEFVISTINSYDSYILENYDKLIDINDSFVNNYMNSKNYKNDMLKTYKDKIESELKIRCKKDDKNHYIIYGYFGKKDNVYNDLTYENAVKENNK